MLSTKYIRQYRILKLNKGEKTMENLIKEIEREHKQKKADVKQIVKKLDLIKKRLAILEGKTNFENRNRKVFYENLNKRIDKVLQIF